MGVDLGPWTGWHSADSFIAIFSVVAPPLRPTEAPTVKDSPRAAGMNAEQDDKHRLMVRRMAARMARVITFWNNMEGSEDMTKDRIMMTKYVNY